MFILILFYWLDLDFHPTVVESHTRERSAAFLFERYLKENLDEMGSASLLQEFNEVMPT